MKTETATFTVRTINRRNFASEGETFFYVKIVVLQQWKHVNLLFIHPYIYILNHVSN